MLRILRGGCTLRKGANRQDFEKSSKCASCALSKLASSGPPPQRWPTERQSFKHVSWKTSIQTVWYLNYRVYNIKYDQINFELAISHVLQEPQATDFLRLFISLVLQVGKVTAV